MRKHERVGRSPVPGSRVILRAFTRGALLLASLLLGACEELPTNPLPPVEPAKLLAQIQLDFDPGSGAVTATTHPVADDDRTTIPNIAAAWQVVNDYFTILRTGCDECKNGVWDEVHTPYVSLRAKPRTMIYNLGAIVTSCTNCDADSPVLSDGRNPVLAGDIVVVLVPVHPRGPGKFSVRFNLWGEPVEVA